MNTKIMNALRFVVLDENINDKKTPVKTLLELRHRIDESAGTTHKPKGNTRHTACVLKHRMFTLWLCGKGNKTPS